MRTPTAAEFHEAYDYLIEKGVEEAMAEGMALDYSLEELKAQQGDDIRFDIAHLDDLRKNGDESPKPQGEGV